jgi:hypothetical protein
MAREYVTICEEQRDGQTIWTSTTVSHDRLKSAPAKVTRRQNRYSIMGAAWGAPIAAVQVQIDDGPWMAARLESPAPIAPADVQIDDGLWAATRLESHALHRKRSRGYAWRFWTFEWGTPASGEHIIRSRAFDVDRNVQPAPNDPLLASKRTYWASKGEITRRVGIH